VKGRRGERTGGQGKGGGRREGDGRRRGRPPNANSWICP